MSTVEIKLQVLLDTVQKGRDVRCAHFRPSVCDCCGPECDMTGLGTICGGMISDCDITPEDIKKRRG